jgi:tetratricopeptide (TPR) repeat protein
MRPTLLISLLFASFLFVRCSSPDQPVTFDEAENFSKQIDSSINYRNPKYFTSLINLKELSKRIEKSSPRKLSSAMEKGIGQGLDKTDMGGQIIRQVEKKGSYELVKHYEKDKVHHLVYRLYSEEGLNYHDFELVKKNGKVSIADYYIYLAGENFSSMLANLLTLFEKPSGNASDDEYKSMETLQRIKSLMNQGQAKEAKDLFDQLPDKFRDQKTIRIIGLQLSSQIDNEMYLKGLEDFQARYPNEPNTYLLMLDAAILNKDYEKALSNINHLDSLINKDKFLDFYRALMYNLMEEPAKAREHLETLVQNYPTFEAGILELIANYLQANDYDKATPLIENFRKNKEFDQDVLDAVVGMYPGYTG